MNLRERVNYLESVYRFTLDALESAADLSDFQNGITSFDSPGAIILEAVKRIRGIIKLDALAIYRVDETTSDFCLTYCDPEQRADYFEQECDLQADRGVFAQALDLQKPVFSKTLVEGHRDRPLLLHRLATASRIRGMLVALPATGLKHIPDSSLHLLSLIMLNTANCLESHELYGLLHEANRRLASQLQDLDRQKAFYHQLFENSPLGLALLSPDGHIREINPGFEGLFGYSRLQAVGRGCAELLFRASYREIMQSLHGSILAGQSVSRELQATDSRGNDISVSLLGYPVTHEGQVEAVYYSFQDVSSRKAFEEQLTYQAFHDSLTGLPNRALFIERLDRAIKRAARDPQFRFAVLMLDVDRFKSINDSLGHVVGDRLLQEIAQRLAATVREMDTVARLGGDEFAMILEGFHRPKEVLAVAGRCRRALERPFDIDGQTIYTGASLGAVLRWKGAESPVDMLRNADIAMYRAKEAGGNTVKLFNRNMFNATLSALSLENEMRHALENERFELYYQPIMDVEQGTLSGFEALLRWNHPEKGFVSPDAFIGLAEETGLIVPLGEWALREACRQTFLWNQRYPGLPQLSVNVNLSPKQLGLRSLPGMVESVLCETGLPPSCLKLEITESAMMSNVKLCIEVLQRLKGLGLQLLIDDFGTGYSSLSYLHTLPVDYLKIDRSFVRGNGHMGKPEIVATVMALVRSLNIRAVAEGVEHELQLQELRRLHCHLAQGYLFAPPLHRGDVELLLQGRQNGKLRRLTPSFGQLGSCAIC